MKLPKEKLFSSQQLLILHIVLHIENRFLIFQTNCTYKWIISFDIIVFNSNKKVNKMYVPITYICNGVMENCISSRLLFIDY